MLELILIVMLLGVIFFCTLASAALRAIPIDRMRHLREEGGQDSVRIKYWITHSHQITWALRICSRLSCIGIALMIVRAIVGHSLPLLALNIALIATAILIVFPGSLVPLAWGQRSGERIGLRLMPVIKFFAVVLSPFSHACRGILNAVLVVVKKAPLSFKPLSLSGDLDQLVGEKEAVKELDQEEKKMIRQIFKFGDMTAKEVMTPRTSMRCLSEDDTVSHALRFIEEEHHSRIPVYRGKDDNVVGILYAKDLLRRSGSLAMSEVRVGRLMREPLYVPETKKLDDLFSELRRKRIHMAIVVDEYGCTTGLVTMEDILEEIVGEIQDEYDSEEEELYEKIGEGAYRVDARLSVSDARDEMGIAIPESDEYETVGGFVCSLCGKVPAVGETMEWNGYVIRVLETSGRSVIKLEIRRTTVKR
jgi:putative hemolysin